MSSLLDVPREDLVAGVQHLNDELLGRSCEDRNELSLGWVSSCLFIRSPVGRADHLDKSATLPARPVEFRIRRVTGYIRVLRGERRTGLLRSEWRVSCSTAEQCPRYPDGGRDRTSEDRACDNCQHPFDDDECITGWLSDPTLFAQVRADLHGRLQYKVPGSAEHGMAGYGSRRGTSDRGSVCSFVLLPAKPRHVSSEIRIRHRFKSREPPRPTPFRSAPRNCSSGGNTASTSGWAEKCRLASELEPSDKSSR
jgi:hypothetical protein